MRRIIQIWYDVRMLGHSGIGTQVENVCRGLADRSDVQLTLLGDPARIERFVPGFRGTTLEWRAGIYSVEEQLRYPEPSPEALLLLPHYNVPLRRVRRAVVVVHDLIHLHSREFRSPHYQLYARLLLSRVARRARRILTVSEHTRQDFVAHFPDALGRTVANPNGIDHTMFRPPSPGEVNRFRRAQKLPERFLLCIGIGKKHKNVDFVIRSLAPTWASGALELPLVLAGTGGALPDYVRENVPADALRYVRVLPRLPAEDLPRLYGAATMLIMPSLLEGFGFPVAEAMACGTPVLSSDATSLPEVGGDAAEYFNPLSAISFVDRVLALLKKPARLAAMGKRGPKQAKRFTWQRHTDRLLTVLREIS